MNIPKMITLFIIAIQSRLVSEMRNCYFFKKTLNIFILYWQSLLFYTFQKLCYESWFKSITKRKTNLMYSNYQLNFRGNLFYETLQRVSVTSIAVMEVFLMSIMYRVYTLREHVRAVQRNVPMATRNTSQTECEFIL